MEKNDNLYNSFEEEEDKINIREIIEQYLYFWKWFLFGLIICMLGAYLYLRYSTPEYSAESKIILLDESNSMAGEMAALQDLSILSDGKTNIDDQIEVLKSRRLMMQVVKNLNLNVQYFKEGRIITTEIYREKVPLKLTQLNNELATEDTLRANFKVKILSATEFEIIEENKKFKSKAKFGQKINSPIGEIMLLPSGTDFSKNINQEFYIKVTPFMKVVEHYRNAIKADATGASGRKNSVITLSLVDNVKQKAINILDELVVQYNTDAINDKKLVGEKTSKFISDRLDLVSGDLRGADKNVQEFKSSNNVTDLMTETGINLQSSAGNDSKLLEYSTQLNLVNYMNEYLKNNQNELVPVNIGLDDLAINATTEKYNELVLERDAMLKHSTEKNPIVQSLNQQIGNLGQTLRTSLNNYKQTAQIAVGNIQKQGGTFESKISAFPNQEREFRDISRQQQIFEAIYLFLLQKREETEIANAATPSKIKIVDYAYGNDTPVSPKKNIIYLAAAILGLLIPFGILYVRFLLDNKIHTRKEVEEVVKAPVIGDVPTSEKTFIEQNDRSVLAEAFRIIRTNINFYLSGNKRETKNIYITSTVSGEGKTFVATNLATILSSSTTKNRVLIIEADIRSPKVLDYLSIKNLMSNRKGITHFLMDDDLNIEDITIKDSSFAFDIISAGVLAPNPSELLMNGRFQQIIDQAQGRYDYVVVDTAPVSLVTDTQLIADKADLFIYVARANYLDKRLLNVPRELYRDKKLPNMAMLLNDVGAGRGYGYGYGYGTGYGYGYGYVQKKKKWYERFLPKNIFKKK